MTGEAQLAAVDCLTSFASVAGIVLKKVVVVHPIVLLSVVDHYNRVAKGTTRRVIGCLLGEIVGEEVHVSNSFAIPFDEDAKDSKVWYLDHNYLEYLYRMFKKVNSAEKILGWYSTGANVRAQDLEIHEIFRNYCQNPVYIIVDINPKDTVVPTKAYYSYEEPTSSKDFRRTFVHVASTIGAYEAEEVGVEHLLRDLKNASTSTLATRVGDKLATLRMLADRLQEIALYLSDVISNKLRLNPNIIYTIQEIFNLLPDTSQLPLLKAFATETNDSMLALYLSSLVRAVLALHNLIDNKVENKHNSDNKAKEEAKAEADALDSGVVEASLPVVDYKP